MLLSVLTLFVVELLVTAEFVVEVFTLVLAEVDWLTFVLEFVLAEVLEELLVPMFRIVCSPLLITLLVLTFVFWLVLTLVF